MRLRPAGVQLLIVWGLVPASRIDLSPGGLCAPDGSYMVGSNAGKPQIQAVARRRS